MGRLILIAVAIMILVWLVRRALAAPRGREPEANNQDQGNLVACAHCGVNLPKGEARSAGGRHYCSEEHWRLGPKER